MLNDGRGFADIFEQECLVHADKLNSKTRYDEWLGKMKVSLVYITGFQLHSDKSMCLILLVFESVPGANQYLSC